MMSCLVQCCSRCVPDVFLFVQMFMYHPSILLCYVSICTHVADVFTFKNMCITMCLFDKICWYLVIRLCGHLSLVALLMALCIYVCGHLSWLSFLCLCNVGLIFNGLSTAVSDTIACQTPLMVRTWVPKSNTVVGLYLCGHQPPKAKMYQDSPSEGLISYMWIQSDSDLTSLTNFQGVCVTGLMCNPLAGNFWSTPVLVHKGLIHGVMTSLLWQTGVQSWQSCTIALAHLVGYKWRFHWDSPSEGLISYMWIQSDSDLTSLINFQGVCVTWLMCSPLASNFWSTPVLVHKELIHGVMTSLPWQLVSKADSHAPLPLVPLNSKCDCVMPLDCVVVHITFIHPFHFWFILSNILVMYLSRYFRWHLKRS